jgi:hypothetical protein
MRNGDARHAAAAKYVLPFSGATFTQHILSNVAAQIQHMNVAKFFRKHLRKPSVAGFLCKA